MPDRIFEGGQWWIVEDPPRGETASQHQRDWMNAVSRLDWGTLINTYDWGGVGPTDGLPFTGEELGPVRYVRRGYVQDFGWLSFLRESGGGYTGDGGYVIEARGDYGEKNMAQGVRYGYAYVPWPEGIPEMMDRMAGILSVGYEQAVQGMLTPPDRILHYHGVLPDWFQPQIDFAPPWEFQAGW